MHITRRALLGSSALVCFGVAGCGAVVTPPIIIQTAGTLASGLAGAVTQIAAAYPALIPPATLATIQADLALAKTAAGQLSATLPAATGAVTVRTVEGYINAVLGLLAGPPINGLIPPPYNAAIGAAAVLLPVLEAFVNQYLPTAAASPASVGARATLMAAVPGMTTDQARATLASYAR